MPKKSEKQKLLDVLIDKTISDVIISTSNNDDEIDEVLNNFCFNYMIGLSFRYGTPFEHGSVAKSRDVLCKVLPDLDEKRFREMMRVNWNVFIVIVNLIKNDDVFNGPNAWRQFPVEIQVAIVLYRLGCYGEGSSIGKVAKLFGIGDGGTISIITKRVFKAICSLNKEYLYWPSVNERKEIVMRTYEELPYCIGYVDGTEIRLAEKPTQDPEAFFSRKHQYSLKMQVVCDHKIVIRHAVIGYPGSVHDSRIYKNCPLYTNSSKYFSENEWVLGDNAYKLSTTVITPYRLLSTIGTPLERKNFNQHISKYRVRIENCFASLKERFPSLKELKLTIGTDKNNKFACQWILSCLILHNIIQKDGSDEEFYNEESTDNNIGNDEDKTNNETNEISEINYEAENKRRAILEIIKGFY